jgi:hypothetical protein
MSDKNPVQAAADVVAATLNIKASDIPEQLRKQGNDYKARCDEIANLIEAAFGDEPDEKEEKDDKEEEDKEKEKPKAEAKKK